MSSSDSIDANPLVTSYRLADLVDAISLAIGPATHLTGPEPLDSPTSCWLYKAAQPDTNGCVSPTAVAAALLAFRDDDQSVFPWHQAGERKVRGWEIRSVRLGTDIVIVATATLVDDLAHA